MSKYIEVVQLVPKVNPEPNYVGPKAITDELINGETVKVITDPHFVEKIEWGDHCVEHDPEVGVVLTGVLPGVETEQNRAVVELDDTFTDEVKESFKKFYGRDIETMEDGVLALAFETMGLLESVPPAVEEPLQSEEEITDRDRFYDLKERLHKSVDFIVYAPEFVDGLLFIRDEIEKLHHDTTDIDELKELEKYQQDYDEIIEEASKISIDLSKLKKDEIESSTDEPQVDTWSLASSDFSDCSRDESFIFRPKDEIFAFAKTLGEEHGLSGIYLEDYVTAFTNLWKLEHMDYVHENSEEDIQPSLDFGDESGQLYFDFEDVKALERTVDCLDAMIKEFTPEEVRQDDFEEFVEDEE